MIIRCQVQGARCRADDEETYPPNPDKAEPISQFELKGHNELKRLPTPFYRRIPLCFGRGTRQDREHFDGARDAAAAQGRAGYRQDHAGTCHCRDPGDAVDRAERQVQHEADRSPLSVRHADTPERQPFRRFQARREPDRGLHPHGQDRSGLRKRRPAPCC